MNITTILLDEPSTSYAAVFTSNQFPGGPIYVGKDRLANQQPLQAIIVNNKISNVCPGGIKDGGIGDSELICEAVALQFNLQSKTSVFPSSTGVIGWRLPVDAMIGSLPSLKQNLQNKTLYPAALGITTTDRYPKARTYTSKDGTWTLTGTAKGAGMIEPNMATMLAYLLTDLNLSSQILQQLLKKCVDKTFNALSIDGDQSTSDTVLLLSSQQVTPSSSMLSNTIEEFEHALLSVSSQLANDIVRNGEGTLHVIKVTIEGAPSVTIARGIGKAIVNSNLVKCAISGNDPNVGRIAGAIGSYFGTLPLEISTKLSSKLEIYLGGIKIFSDKSFQLNTETELFLSDYMLNSQLFPSTIQEHDRNYPPHNRCVDIVVKINNNDDDDDRIDDSIASMTEPYVVLGSDLTKEYVEVNADYRS